MKLRGFITHKAAEYYSDCADYFRICPQTKRVAVSDGVGQSVMPSEWAKLLVDSYLRDEWDPGSSTYPLMEKWIQQAWNYVNEQKKQGNNPWLLENCLINKDGAAATFCGLQFTHRNDWSASILGDSSLVILDGENRIIQIYSSKEGAFDFRPDFFESFGNNKGEIRSVSGQLENEQKILLVSDPFSELFQNIKGTESEIPIINRILNIFNTKDFNTLVDSLRTDYHMHNDDSTLVIIEPDETDSFCVVYEDSTDSLLEEEKKRLEEEQKEVERKKEQDDELWGKAIEEDNDEAYRSYLGMSELCAHKKEAEKRLHEIAEMKTEDETWKGACSFNKIEGYQKYIELFPSGRFSAEAKERINKLGIPSTHRKKPEGKNDLSENQSSEDSFCKEDEQTKKEQPLQEGVDMDKDSTATPEEEHATVDSIQAEAKPEGVHENESSKSDDSSSEGTELVHEKSGEASRKIANSERTSCGVNTKEVEVEGVEGERSLSLPSGVNPSDGIDKVEFHKLQETALLLFKKYHDRFEAAFRRQKWNSDRSSGINHCFVDFWCELERIIYKNKNNG